MTQNLSTAFIFIIFLLPLSVQAQRGQVFRNENGGADGFTDGERVFWKRPSSNQRGRSSSSEDGFLNKSTNPSFRIEQLQNFFSDTTKNTQVKMLRSEWDALIYYSLNGGPQIKNQAQQLTQTIFNFYQRNHSEWGQAGAGGDLLNRTDLLKVAINNLESEKTSEGRLEYRETYEKRQAQLMEKKLPILRQIFTQFPENMSGYTANNPLRQELVHLAQYIDSELNLGTGVIKTPELGSDLLLYLNLLSEKWPLIQSAHLGSAIINKAKEILYNALAPKALRVAALEFLSVSEPSFITNGLDSPELPGEFKNNIPGEIRTSWNVLIRTLQNSSSSEPRSNVQNK